MRIRIIRLALVIGTVALFAATAPSASSVDAKTTPIQLRSQDLDAGHRALAEPSSDHRLLAPGGDSGPGQVKAAGGQSAGKGPGLVAPVGGSSAKGTPGIGGAKPVAPGSKTTTTTTNTKACQLKKPRALWETNGTDARHLMDADGCDGAAQGRGAPLLTLNGVKLDTAKLHDYPVDASEVALLKARPFDDDAYIYDPTNPFDPREPKGYCTRIAAQSAQPFLVIDLSDAVKFQASIGVIRAKLREPGNRKYFVRDVSTQQKPAPGGGGGGQQGQRPGQQQLLPAAAPGAQPGQPALQAAAAPVLPASAPNKRALEAAAGPGQDQGPPVAPGQGKGPAAPGQGGGPAAPGQGKGAAAPGQAGGEGTATNTAAGQLTRKESWQYKTKYKTLRVQWEGGRHVDLVMGHNLYILGVFGTGPGYTQCRAEFEPKGIFAFPHTLTTYQTIKRASIKALVGNTEYWQTWSIPKVKEALSMIGSPQVTRIAADYDAAAANYKTAEDALFNLAKAPKKETEADKTARLQRLKSQHYAPYETAKNAREESLRSSTFLLSPKPFDSSMIGKT